MKRTLSAVGAALLMGGLLAGIGPAATAAAPPATAPDPAIAPLSAASLALTQHRPALQASTSDAFTVRKSTVDPGGAAHAHHDRSYRGLRVRPPPAATAWATAAPAT